MGVGARKNIGKPYKGILAEPMPQWTVLTRPSDEEIDTLMNEKLRALFVHFEVGSTDMFEGGPKMVSAWANLVWYMAREHVPGFQRALRKRGRPPTGQSDDVALNMHVELLKRRDGLSERKAIKTIACHNLVGGTEQSLLQRYKRAKKHFELLSQVFDNATAAIGREAFVQAMEEALSGDNKETFLSPD